MIKRIVTILLLSLFCLAVPAQKQKTKQATTKTTATKKQPVKKQAAPKLTKRQQLEDQKKKVQQQQTEARKRQQELEKKVKNELEHVQILDGEIKDKQLTIDSIRQDIVVLDSNIVSLDEELKVLQKELADRKEQYMKSMRYMYRNRKTQNKMMFMFSAKNFNQMFRRMRFSKEYSTYEKMQGQALKVKSEQVEAKQKELNGVKDEKSALLSRSQQEHRQMEQKQTEQKKLVVSLQKEQKTVKQLIAQQQKEEKELNAKIEREIKAEIARAEAEARRLAAEEARRKAAEEAKRAKAAKDANKNTKGTTKTTATASRDKTKVATPKAEHFELPAADRALSGSFESNKGRLPVPITGPYNIVRGMGTYDVTGTPGVTLESKGIYLKGKDGAQARCVFDGQVTAVVQRGQNYMVIVRHGRYISVYCNLASVSVSNRQQVKINQILGKVADDHVMQFQLRNWTDPLNPRQWLSK